MFVGRKVITYPELWTLDIGFVLKLSTITIKLIQHSSLLCPQLSRKITIVAKCLVFIIVVLT